MRYRCLTYFNLIVIIWICYAAPVSALTDNRNLIAFYKDRSETDSTLSNEEWLKNPKLETLVSETKKSWREFENNFRLDFFLTLHGSLAINQPDQSGWKNLFQSYYNLTIQDRFQLGITEIRFNLFHEWGYLWKDKQGQHKEDLLQYSLDLLIGNSGRWKWSGNFQSKSQLFNHYQIKDNSDPKRYLESSYFTPGYLSMGAGMSYLWKQGGKVELALLGGQVTKMKNLKVYEERESNELLGIKQGQKMKLNLGIGLQFQQPIRKLSKQIYWENQSRVSLRSFKNPIRNSTVFDIQNAFYFLTFKYLRIGLRSVVQYNPDLSEKIMTSQLILFGFYLSNKL